MVNKTVTKVRVNYDGRQRTIYIHEYHSQSDFETQYKKSTLEENRPWYTRRLGVLPRSWSTDTSNSIYVAPDADYYTDYHTLIAHEIGHLFGLSHRKWLPTTMNVLPVLRIIDMEGLLKADIETLGTEEIMDSDSYGSSPTG